VKKADPVKEFFREKIVFSFESKQIPESIKSELNNIAKVLAENPTAKVRIEGHTSTDGTDAQNTIVSERRAKLVKDYLLSKGVKENQMVTKAMLATELLVPDTTLENKKINRRAEIELVE
jgi:outer membrane protein OmpA-like peptidoglycan-associated protein